MMRFSLLLWRSTLNGASRKMMFASWANDVTIANDIRFANYIATDAQ